MTNQAQEDFLAANGGELTPELAARFMELGEQGDTDLASDKGGAPGAATATDQDDDKGGEGGKGGQDDADATKQTQQQQTEPAAGELTAENAVILARDGKHTISYDKLIDARTKAQEATAALETARAEIAALKEQAQARADAGQDPTQADKQLAAAEAAIEAGANPAIFGDFSEEALAKGINTLIEQRVQAELEKALAPVKAREAQGASKSHYDAIYAKHPDADSIVESAELQGWIKSQPSFAQDAIRSVLERGTTAQVIELFDRFKSDTKPAASAAETKPSDEELKAKARAAVASAAPAVPNSLSDIHGSTAAGVSDFEKLAAAGDGAAMLEDMSDWSPEKINRFLERTL